MAKPQALTIQNGKLTMVEISDRFSIRRVSTLETLTIPTYQMMLIRGRFTLIGRLDLEVNGRMALI